MQWLFLVLAGLAEVAFAFCLGKAILVAGAEALGWGAAFLACAALSFGLLNLSPTQVPLGTAYAVWTGIGTAAVGVVAFGDRLARPRLFLLVTLIRSVLRFSAVSH